MCDFNTKAPTDTAVYGVNFKVAEYYTEEFKKMFENPDNLYFGCRSIEGGSNDKTVMEIIGGNPENNQT